MKLTIQKTTNTEIIIGFPSFYKHKEIDWYYAVLGENDCMMVNRGYSGNDVKIDQKYPISGVFDGKEIVITKKEFTDFYSKAVTEINKNFVEVIDDIAMLTENDSEPSDPAQDELEWEKHQQTQTL